MCFVVRINTYVVCVELAMIFLLAFHCIPKGEIINLNVN